MIVLGDVVLELDDIAPFVIIFRRICDQRNAGGRGSKGRCRQHDERGEYYDREFHCDSGNLD